MFVFEFDRALFKFSAASPALPPLLRLPPRIGKLQQHPLCWTSGLRDARTLSTRPSCGLFRPALLPNSHTDAWAKILAASPGESAGAAALSLYLNPAKMFFCGTACCR